MKVNGCTCGLHGVSLRMTVALRQQLNKCALNRGRMALKPSSQLGKGVHLPKSFGKMPDWVIKHQEEALDERITALLPKIQECATLSMFCTYIEWDLPKLRQVLKEGL